jgi:GT2 family glycosyltransferase
MGRFINRLRTIAGNDASWPVIVQRLAFYSYHKLKYGKLFRKLFFRPANESYESYIRKREDQYRETDNNHFNCKLAIIIIGDDRGQIRTTLDSFNGQGKSIAVYTTADLQEDGIKHLSPAEDVHSRVAEEYIFALNAGDRVTPHFIPVICNALNQSPLASVWYPDTDHVSPSGGRQKPEHHPDWSPDYFNNTGYIHYALVRKPFIPALLPASAPLFTIASVFNAAENKAAIAHIPEIIVTAARKEAIAPDLMLEHVKRDIPGSVLLEEQKTISRIAYPVTNDPLISIIIPTRNRSELVRQCINSVISKSTYTRYEIILVDNRSTEPALGQLIDTYSSQLGDRFIHCIADIEFNFSALINMGRSKSKGELLVLLNNDVEIITPGWLELMAGYALKDHMACVGAKLLYPDSSVQHAGIVLNKEMISRHIHLASPRYGTSYQNALNTVRNYAAVTAACLMVSRAKFDEVHGFNERFRVEYNDIDFCLRLLKKDYYNVYLPFVELYHYESASRRHPHSSRSSLQQYNKERLLFTETWSAVIANDPFNTFDKPV